MIRQARQETQPIRNDDLDAIVQERVARAQMHWRKGLQARAKQADDLETENRALRERLAALEQRGDDPPADPQTLTTPAPEDLSTDPPQPPADDPPDDPQPPATPPAPAADDPRAELEALRMEKRISARDKELREALYKFGAVDVKAAERYFLPDISYDDDTGQWICTIDGERLSIRAAVQKHLPDYLRKPKALSGGSGAMQAFRAQQATTELTRLQAELLAVQRHARATGAGDDDLRKFTTIQRRIAELRRQQNY